MKNELEDYNRKFAQFPEKIKAEIAAIEVRLVVMGASWRYSKNTIKSERPNLSIRPL